MSNLKFKNVASLILIAVGLTVGLPAKAVDEGTYKFDPDHTNIGFEVSHMGYSITVGRFNKFDGNVVFVPNGDSKIDFSITTSSVDTNSDKRDDHLRRSEFFDCENFPKMTFQSTAVEYDANGAPKVIKGELTLLGRKQPVVLAVTPVGEGRGLNPFEKRAGFRAKATIKRSLFGMEAYSKVVGDDINIRIDTELIKQ